MSRVRLRSCPLCLLAGCALLLAPAVAGGKDKGKSKDTFAINGYVGLSSTQPASRRVVKLLDESGKVLGTAETGVFGKFKFENVKPGLYVLQVGEVKREVLVKDKDKRADIDLSAKDGVMRTFSTEKLAEALGGAAGGTAAGPAPGPNDASLQQSMAGMYWGYQGSTEVKLALCSNGRFQEYSESSYSGTSRDSQGNQTMAWGAAGQGGNRGNWSIQGNLQQGTVNLAYSGGKTVPVRYQAIDNQCFSFNSRKLCRTGPAECR